jgi:hypothetical protein
MRAAAAALILALAAGGARADRVSPPPPTATEVAKILNQDRVSDGYRAASALVAAHPDEPEGHYLLASAELSMNRLDDADAQIQLGLASAHGPIAAHLHGLRATLAAARADDATAGREADLALAIDPREPLGLDVRHQLDLADRFAHGGAPTPAPGAPALVQRFFALIAQGATAAELADMLDPGILAKAPPIITRDTSGLIAVVEGVFAALHAQADGAGMRVVAWEVSPEPTRAEVQVELLVENVFTPARVETMRQLYADPATRALIDPETRATFDGLDPADREATLHQMIGQRRRTLMPISVLVAGAGARARIGDLSINGVSVRDEFVPNLATPTAPAAAPAPAPESGGPLLLMIGGPALIVVGAVGLAWRRRARAARS